jgi:hypothetical protein
MVKKIRFLSVVMMLICSVFFGIRIDGHSQERPVSQEKHSIQESSNTQKPLENPRLKRVGILVTADLNVAPPTYTGPCPTVFTLKGQIYASKAVTALYKLVRSDNAPMEPIELKFEKEDQKEVVFTWQLDSATRPAGFNEWAVIEVVYPINTKIRSNVVYLKGNCTNQTGFKQEGAFSQQEGQKGPPVAPPGFPGSLPQDKGLAPAGFPMSQPGQQGQLPPGDFPMIQPGQGGQPPGSLPIPQSGQKGPVPMNMPIPKPN